MSQIQLIVDGVTVYSSGTTTVPPVTPPAPPNPPVPPIVPPVGTNVLVWEPLQTVGFFPIPAVQFSGDAGIAIRIFADATQYPNGLTVGVWDQGPISILKEAVISQNPNDFRVVGNNVLRGSGGGGMFRGVYFYDASTGHTTPRPGDAVVQAHQYFYINTRQYWTPRSAIMSAQFSASVRT